VRNILYRETHNYPTPFEAPMLGNFSKKLNLRINMVFGKTKHLFPSYKQPLAKEFFYLLESASKGGCQGRLGGDSVRVQLLILLQVLEVKHILIDGSLHAQRQLLILGQLMLLDK